MKNFLFCLLGVALTIGSIPIAQRLSAQSTSTTRILIPFAIGNTNANNSGLVWYVEVENTALRRNPTICPKGQLSQGRICG